MESNDDQSDHQGIVNLQKRRRAVLLDRLAVLATREPDIMEKIEAAAAIESIGDTIQRVVAERGLTPYAVAKLAGKRNFTDIREFLRGERDVKLSTVEAICRGLGLTLQPKMIQVPPDENFDDPAVLAALDYDTDLSYNLTQKPDDDDEVSSHTPGPVKGRAKKRCKPKS